MALLIWLAEIAVTGLMLRAQVPPSGMPFVYGAAVGTAIVGLILWIRVVGALRWLCGFGAGWVLILAAGFGHMDWLATTGLVDGSASELLPIVPGLVGVALIGVSLAGVIWGRG